LRRKVPIGRPSTRRPQAVYSTGKVIGDHGSPPWPAMDLYHNTFVMAEASRQADMATLGGPKPERPRRVFNNVFLHLGRLAGFVGPDSANGAVEDGNLYWAPGVEAKTAAAFFQRFRASERFAQSKKLHPPGSTTHSLVA